MNVSPSRLARRMRAERLGRSARPAAEMLVFLAQLTEAQDPLYHVVSGAAWLPTVDDAASLPRLQWSRIPWSELDPESRGFADALSGFGPPPVREAAAAWRDLPPLRLAGWLEGSVDPLPTEPAALAFVAAAVRQVTAEAFAEQLVSPESGQTSACAVCGGGAGVSLLRDEGELKGRRVVVCSVCASEWPVPRARCVSCGNESRTELAIHEDESTGHVRIETCARCRRYTKTIDLRKDGLADPFADDVATLTLDLWATEQGWTRNARSLLGV